MTPASVPGVVPSRLAAPWTAGPALVERSLGKGRLALGLAGVGGAWGKVDEAESLATVRLALERGIQAFDLAPAYGSAERILGAALAGWCGEAPVISTKVGRQPASDPGGVGAAISDYTAAGMRRSLETSLRTLGLPQLDLLFLHEPQLVAPAERPRVVRVLREFQTAGLARRLGLAGGHGADWDGFLESGAFDVVMLFRRFDPCIFDGLTADVPRLRRLGLGIYGASPLHMGLLGARYEEFLRTRPDWIWPADLERAVSLRALAEQSGLALSSLAHRFMFGAEGLDRVVIGASNRAQLETALDDFAAGPLPAELFAAVCEIHNDGVRPKNVN